ncbi:hypothetical protein OGAPHI_000697 [Ogataea philodendri]|uniref:Uncharacterized protein n=1 Tax=Ogataea philodendri TaxID=1378263 RepID=A0A9P8TAD1_9ASCO|nr:uncharacterized protein OGAPHI_000697 [Ogataea philodendri]KAH3670986.1 hypothetical protein OGAPHI_000697 [Ogataea philodendri]
MADGFFSSCEIRRGESSFPSGVVELLRISYRMLPGANACGFFIEWSLNRFSGDEMDSLRSGLGMLSGLMPEFDVVPYEDMTVVLDSSSRPISTEDSSRLISGEPGLWSP